MSLEGRVVCITWSDAWFDAEETNAADWKEDFVVETYGLCVEDTPLLLRVAMDHHPGENYKGVIHIPKKYISRTKVYR